MLVSGPSQRFVSQVTPKHGWEEQTIPSELLVLGWTAAGLLFVASLGILPYQQWIAVCGFFSATVLVVHLASIAIKSDNCSLLCHEVLIGPDFITLQTSNLVDGLQTEVSLPFSEIKFAERDSSTLTVHGVTERINIPLWSFGKNAILITELLSRSGIRLIDRRSGFDLTARTS